MNCVEAVEQIIAFSDNIGPSGADDNTRRQRILYYLIEEASSTYYAREWVYRLKMTQAPHIVIPANQGYGELPTDFLEIGKLGRVWNDTQNGIVVDPAVESEVGDLIATNVKMSNSAIFTIFDYTPGDPPRQRIWLPLSDTPITLRLLYHRKLPTLDLAANSTNLDLAIPPEYQQTVLIPGTRGRARKSLGDERWQDDMAERERGLEAMIRNLRRMQGGEQQLPSFFGR